MFSVLPSYFFFKVCIPCKISYYAILKLETLDRDLDWISKILDLKAYQRDFYSTTVQSMEKKKNAATTSTSLSKKYFSQISKLNISRLYQKYQIDFEMFGYEDQIQKYIDMGRN